MFDWVGVTLCFLLVSVGVAGAGFHLYFSVFCHFDSLDFFGFFLFAYIVLYYYCYYIIEFVCVHFLFFFWNFCCFCLLFFVLFFIFRFLAFFSLFFVSSNVFASNFRRHFLRILLCPTWGPMRNIRFFPCRTMENFHCGCQLRVEFFLVEGRNKF